MENKKTFGAYILKRRRELGMTQREFAEKLFVTESAVSKWERGLSYPDITILNNICEVLEISEYELLNSGEDTKRKTSERLAEKYLRLTRNYRIAQYIIYGLALLVCAIVDIAVNHALSWFLVVFASVMTAASLTLVPSVVSAHTKLERYSATISAACFMFSLELLLFICCARSGGRWFAVSGISALFGCTLVMLPLLMPRMPLSSAAAKCKAAIYLITETALLILLLLTVCIYTGGNWFGVASIGTLFGVSLFITPVLLKQLPFPEWISSRKASAYLLIETVLLILLLLVCCVYTKGSWFGVASMGTLFGLSLFITPVLLKQLPLPEWISLRKASAYLLIETVLLLLLLLVCCAYTGGSWFGVTAMGTIFGLGFIATPVVLRQTLRGMPVYRHWTALFFGIQSVLLFVLLIIADIRTGADDFMRISLPSALTGLALPWGILIFARYLPVNGWFRASAGCTWSALWIWLSPFLIQEVLTVRYGAPDHAYNLIIPFDLLDWSGAGRISGNVTVIVLFVLAALAAAFLTVGAVRLASQAEKEE